MKRTPSFFSKQTPQSRKKATIIVKYFESWLKVIGSRLSLSLQTTPVLRYVDLFSGPGVYEDGNVSTPIMILQSALNSEYGRQYLQCHFNDAAPEAAQRLMKEIMSIDGIECMTHTPVVTCTTVTPEYVAELRNISPPPSLYIFDPFGYKDISLELVRAATEPWGCDAIMYFNYRRINMSISNDAFEEHINNFFGPDLGPMLNSTLSPLDPIERESKLIGIVKSHLCNGGDRKVQDFRIRTSENSRTMQYLLFLTKHEKGYTIMKDIMAKESSGRKGGTPSFTYNPIDDVQPSLAFSDDADGDTRELACQLLTEFSGRILTKDRIVQTHGSGRPYINRNYISALQYLVASGYIDTIPPKGPDELRKIPSDLLFRFPSDEDGV